MSQISIARTYIEARRDDIEPDLTWVSDERIVELKQGEDATPQEVLALAGEVRVRRRAMQGESWRDKPPLL